MLTDGNPVGIVSIEGSPIENLYVLPSAQNRGYGTKLLAFAVQKCVGVPTLWILSTNDRAKRFYERNGFLATGNTVRPAGGIWDLEFCLRQL